MDKKIQKLGKECGYIVRKSVTAFEKRFGKWTAYREDGHFSAHFAPTAEETLDNAMDEWGRMLKKLG